MPRRVVPVLPELIERIDAQRQYGESAGALDFVLTSTWHRPMTTGTFQHVFGEAREDAGVNGIAPHSLRHLYASALIAAGESVVVVQRRLGHASPMETLATYGHLWPDSEESTRDALRSKFGDLVG